MWALFGALLAIVIKLVRPEDFHQGESVLGVALVFGIVGFLSGAVFALVFAIAERRRTIGDLSVGRAAGWGALASSALPLLSTMDNGMIVIFAPLGALFAASSVALAKREARLELARGDLGSFEHLN